MTRGADDAFSLDLRRDLEKVDSVMTEVIRDPATTDEFVRDPNGVLSRLGLHPPASSDEINDRANRIFYAVLTNGELIEFILEHLQSFEGPVQENEQIFNDALARGEVQNSVELDLAAADHVFRDPDATRRIYQLTLHDLNRRGLLQDRHTDEEIDDYVDRLVESIQQRRSIQDLPELERWDENYGVGTGYGVGEAEVGPVATVGALVEVGVAVTVVIPVFVIGLAAEREMAERAVRLDEGAARTLATAGALLRLGGEMMVHASTLQV
jgi:hypothetical protein